MAAFASFVPHSAQQPHIFNPKESLPFTHHITFRPFLYVPLSFTNSFVQTSHPQTPQKKLHSTQKTPPALLRLPPCSLRFATLRTPCQPPSLYSQRLRLTLRRQGKHSAIATPLSHRLVAQGCFPSRWGKRCFDPKLKNLLKTKSRPKVYYLFSSTLDKPQSYKHNIDSYTSIDYLTTIYSSISSKSSVADIEEIGDSNVDY